MLQSGKYSKSCPLTSLFYDRLTFLSPISSDTWHVVSSASAGSVPEEKETNLPVAVFEGHTGGKSNCIGLPPDTNSTTREVLLDSIALLDHIFSEFPFEPKEFAYYYL